MGETLCPMDFQCSGMIVDTEIFDVLVAQLPSGVKLTTVLDCCHSGTGLDLPFTWANGWVEEDNPAHSAGDVLLLSGCEDDQTSADMRTNEFGRPQGALTNAFCKALESTSTLDHMRLLQGIHSELERGGFRQRPCLTASQKFDLSDNFSPIDTIHPNKNSSLGRHFRKKKHAKRQNLLQGGLGETLALSAVGFIAAVAMGRAVENQ